MHSTEAGNPTAERSTEQMGVLEANRSPSAPAEDRLLTVPLHPLGIRPAGNAYTAAKNLKSSAGHFSLLPDELILQLLEFLDHRLLLTLGFTCKALYAFCRFDDLWKTLFIEYVFILFAACSILVGTALTPISSRHIKRRYLSSSSLLTR